MFNIVANDAEIVVSFASLLPVDDTIGVNPVFLIPPKVFSTNVGIEPLPFAIILVTIPYDELILAVCELYVPAPKVCVTELMCSNVGVVNSNPYLKFPTNASGKELAPP